ncbi:chloride channel protein [Helicovermis profundi]|uniref:Chloride channel protein n=1 Tax=Helicovermis profundi TaxID=3065157 RepID=A0AAU9E0V9_9FIRM|nr:hypothetical protein HLPR_05170 [Clostridia bacterium S502]
MLIKNKTKITRGKLVRLLLVAAVIGIVTGILGMAFNYIITNASHSIAESNLMNNKLKFIIVPIIGGILLSLIYKFALNENETGFGVHEVYEEINHIHTFLMKPKSVAIKLIGTLVTLISGLSAGKQGPIVHLGGAVGSNIGYLFKLDDEEIKILVLCGVSGALAGVFDEPIFASIFVIEVLLIRDYVAYSTPIMMSAAMSVFIRRAFLGIVPFVNLSGTFAVGSYKEYILFLILGLLMGIVSGIYIYLIKKVTFFKIKSKLPYYLAPLIGSILIALIGYFYPEIFDLHFNSTKHIFLNNYSLKFLIIIVFIKIIATAITLGTGGFGGGFMPGVFIGAASGGAFSLILMNNFGINLDYSLYALVGMAAMFSGFSGAPLAATLLAVELSGNKEIMLPIFITCIISTVITHCFIKRSLYFDL